MSTVKPEPDLPDFWSEEAYLSLGDSKDRIELIDGGLWVSPSSNNPHNEMLGIVCDRLRHPARSMGLRTLLIPNLRLRPGRIVIPDIAVGRFARVAAMNRASETVLVVEITSPGNAVVDRTLKRQLYAEAKIDWYLLIEPDLDDYETVSLQLLRREGGKYVTHAEAKHGDKLVSGEPFPLEIDTVALLDF